MFQKQLIGFPLKNLEFMNHFHNIVQSNLVDLHYYYPIANIHLLNAADSVYIINTEFYNELNFIQLKTRQSHNKIFQEIYYQEELNKYYGYCNTLQFAFLDKQSFLINSHIQNKIDLSYLYEKSDTNWENTYFNLKVFHYKPFSLIITPESYKHYYDIVLSNQGVSKIYSNGFLPIRSTIGLK